MGMTTWQRGRITLKWSPEHELGGLEIAMRRRPMGALVDKWMAAGGADDRRLWAELSPKERAESTVENAEDLAGLIVSWNYADEDDQPIAPTAENILRHCDDVMINEMWTAYAEGSTRLAPPLSKSSDDGPPSPPSEWDLSGMQEISTDSATSASPATVQVIG